MKKRLLVLMMVLAIGTSGVFAAGSGKSFAVGAQTGYPLGGALTFKVEQLPCVFAANFYSWDGKTDIGLTADWWIANYPITGPWGWYYGVGVFGGVEIYDVADNSEDYFGAVFGPRVFIGTNVVLLDDFLEFFLQGGWGPTFCISNKGFAPDFARPIVELGFRFWF